MSLFFFFQAEDGIRDLTVTGVQTCALPISAAGGTVGQGVQLAARRLRGAGSRSPRDVRPGGPPQQRVLGPPTVGRGARDRGGDPLDSPAGVPAPVLGSP